MKKVFLAALMAVFTSTAFAQLITGKSTGYVQEEKWGWNTFSFEYLALNMSAKELNSSDILFDDYYAVSIFRFWVVFPPT